MLNSLGFKLEGTQKDAVYRNNRYYDVLDYAMLNEEYFKLAKNNDFEINQLIIVFLKSLKATKIN
jgi:hypothetical protein